MPPALLEFSFVLKNSSSIRLMIKKMCTAIEKHFLISSLNQIRKKIHLNWFCTEKIYWYMYTHKFFKSL